MAGHEFLGDLVERSGEELLRVAQSASEHDEVVLESQGREYRYPVRFFLAQAIHHAIEHGTEIKVALNQLGIKTPDLEGWTFAAAMGYGETTGDD